MKNIMNHCYYYYYYDSLIYLFIINAIIPRSIVEQFNDNGFLINLKTTYKFELKLLIMTKNDGVFFFFVLMI